MTSGTKVLLTLIALFVGVLILYYGFLMPTGDQPSRNREGTVRDPGLETPAPTRQSRQPGPKARAGHDGFRARSSP